MTASKPIPPPKDLGTSGRELWRSIVKQWHDDDVSPDARELRLLADACDEADMLTTLQKTLAAEVAEGRLIVKGSQGQPVVSSLVASARASRAQVAALLGKVGMADLAGHSGPAPRGMTAAEAGRLGGQARRRTHG